MSHHGLHALQNIDMSARPPGIYRWRFLADEIEKLIKSGLLPEYTKLPGEREMVAILKIGEATARKAVRELRDRGLLAVLPSKGAFVLPAQPRQDQRHACIVKPTSPDLGIDMSACPPVAYRWWFLANEIRKRIEVGGLPKQLPTQREMAIALKTGLLTVHRALEVLREEGLVTTDAKGTTVTGHIRDGVKDGVRVASGTVSD